MIFQNESETRFPPNGLNNEQTKCELCICYGENHIKKIMVKIWFLLIIILISRPFRYLMAYLRFYLMYCELRYII